MVRKPGFMPGERVIESHSAPVWHQALQGSQTVVHLAGRAHVMDEHARDSLQAFREANVRATLTMAEQAAHAGVRRFVFVSSIKVNGEQTAPGSCFSAQDTPSPSDAYALSKWEAEQGLKKMAQSTDMELVIIRPPLVYGPGVKGNVATLARLARSRLPLPVGGLDARRSLLGLENFERATEHALTSPAAHQRTFIVADPGPLTIPEIVAAMRAGLGRASGIVRVPLAPVRLALRLAGKGETWERIAGTLVVSTAALEASGWRACETAEQGLGRWMRQSVTAA